MVNTTYCKVWATTDEVRQLPSPEFLTGYMTVLACTGFMLLAGVQFLRPQGVRKMLRDAGVAMSKVAKTSREIERKVFHLCGLLVPLIYTVMLGRGYTKQQCANLCWAITLVGVTSDLMRVYIPWVQRNWPMKSILREKEQGQLCGATFFSLGCTLAVQIYDPVIAMTSIIFLVLGDMSAALIGRSFGQSVCSMKVGPGGNKSVEGSVGMFLVCILFGSMIFCQVHLREYAVVIAALTATLVELYEPLGINDNVTIPVLSGLALTFGFWRTYACEPTRSPLLWYSHNS